MGLPLTFHERQPRMGAVMSLGNPPGLMASAAPSSPNPTHSIIISNPALALCGGGGV